MKQFTIILVLVGAALFVPEKSFSLDIVVPPAYGMVRESDVILIGKFTDTKNHTFEVDEKLKGPPEIGETITVFLPYHNFELGESFQSFLETLGKNQTILFGRWHADKKMVAADALQGAFWPQGPYSPDDYLPSLDILELREYVVDELKGLGQWNPSLNKIHRKTDAIWLWTGVVATVLIVGFAYLCRSRFTKLIIVLMILALSGLLIVVFIRQGKQPVITSTASTSSAPRFKTKMKLIHLAFEEAKKGMKIPYGIQPTVEYNGEIAIITWPVPPPNDPNAAVLGPDYYAQVEIERITGKVIQVRASQD